MYAGDLSGCGGEGRIIFWVVWRKKIGLFPDLIIQLDEDEGRDRDKEGGVLFLICMFQVLDGGVNVGWAALLI